MKRNVGKTIVALAVGGFVAGVAWAGTECIPVVLQGGSISGVGAYTAYAKCTNSAGGFWITPSNGITQCTFVDASSFGSNYVSVVTVTPFGKPLICSNSSSMTVTVTNTTRYEFIAYIKSPVPPPTNGETLNLQLNWQ